MAYEDRNVKNLDDDGVELLFHYNISHLHFEGGLIESEQHTIMEGTAVNHKEGGKNQTMLHVVAKTTVNQLTNVIS